MNTARESNVKSIAAIAFVSVMLFGVFYYLITDATSTSSSDLKAQAEKSVQNTADQQTVTQNYLGSRVEAKTDTAVETNVDVKGDATETSVFKALSTQKTDLQPKMVLGGADAQTPESTVPDTGTNTIFGAFVVSSLIMFTGIYLFMTQPKNAALANFEKRIIRDLD